MPLPTDIAEFMRWTWAQMEPYARELAERPLTAANVAAWLADWSALAVRISERLARLRVAVNVNTADAEAEADYKNFLDAIYPAWQAAEQTLKEKLLASGLEPEGFAVPLRNLRAEAALFREANLPLLVEEQKLVNDFDKLIGAQTVLWEGEEKTLPQLQPLFQLPERATREQVWRRAMQRRLQDRATLNEAWQTLFRLRQRIAANAGEPDYRAYVWKNYLRFDYTPADCEQFHAAIEAVAVPAARRIYERRRQQLGGDALRPWDLDVDPLGRAPLRPYSAAEALPATASAIFHRVDPELGAQFEIMRRENLLDLDNRKNKAPGGYCTDFLFSQRPFIFMNSVGLHDDVQTLLHEGGHAFHAFESAALPYYQQLAVGMEFAEVASMSMELLSAPYLAQSAGGFYSEADSARARVEHLENMVLFWPYMAVVDAFQQWAYTHAEAALDPAQCDAEWDRLWARFMGGVDWSGLDDERVTGWQRKIHIFEVPFYYIEYGLAQLGAVQVWRNALNNPARAVADYRRALALGGNAPLPQLYAAAGARFAFDEATVREAVTLIEKTLADLESTD